MKHKPEYEEVKESTRNLAVSRSPHLTMAKPPLAAPFRLVLPTMPLSRSLNRCFPRKAARLMAITTTFLEQGKQKPADIAAMLADFLSGAKTGLHLAIYDFRLSDGLAAPVIKALRDRASA